MLQAHFHANNLNAEQSAFIARFAAKSVSGSPNGFYLQGETFSPSLISEIIALFSCVGIYPVGDIKSGSFKYKDNPWRVSSGCLKMVPGFDNSPTYNVESVELCLL